MGGHTPAQTPPNLPLNCVTPTILKFVIVEDDANYLNVFRFLISMVSVLISFVSCPGISINSGGRTSIGIVAYAGILFNKTNLIIGKSANDA